MYFLFCSSFSPTVYTKYPRAQKCSPVKFLSLLQCCRRIAIVLFPFIYPTMFDTAYLGGILISMCTWLFITCPSSISHSFCFASVWKISPSDFRAVPHNAFFLRLGIKTTWYLQSHVLCVKLWYVFGIVCDGRAHQAFRHTMFFLFFMERSNLFKSHW